MTSVRFTPDALHLFAFATHLSQVSEQITPSLTALLVARLRSALIEFSSTGRRAGGNRRERRRLH